MANSFLTSLTVESLFGYKTEDINAGRTDDHFNHKTGPDMDVAATEAFYTRAMGLKTGSLPPISRPAWGSGVTTMTSWQSVSGPGVPRCSCEHRCEHLEAVDAAWVLSAPALMIRGRRSLRMPLLISGRRLPSPSIIVWNKSQPVAWGSVRTQGTPCVICLPARAGQLVRCLCRSTWSCLVSPARRIRMPVAKSPLPEMRGKCWIRSTRTTGSQPPPLLERPLRVPGSPVPPGSAPR